MIMYLLDLLGTLAFAITDTFKTEERGLHIFGDTFSWD